MRYPSAIVALLILGGASIGGYFLGAASKQKELNALQAEVQVLRASKEELTRLVENDIGMSRETLESMDPITRKHMIMAIWYENQEAGNHLVGRDVGHEWGPRWNRRSPLTILDEQTRVMRTFLTDLRKLEQASPYPPKYPTEDHRDPSDGSRIDWENFLKRGDPSDPRVIHYGKSQGSGNWMAYEFEKGVFTPDPGLLKEIIEHERGGGDEGVLQTIPGDDDDPFADGE